MTGLVGLHGGGEYVTGDEAAMDALLGAALDAAAREGAVTVPRIVIVPTAAARQRPQAAAANGERAFAQAASRARLSVEIGVAGILTRGDAADPRIAEPLASAHLVHLPGGDPDLIPTTLRDSPAWAAIRRASARGAVIAGASAGAMALAGRCWTPSGVIDGLGLVPGYAVLPHDGPGRLDRWRAALGDVRLFGLAEQTLALGRPGGAWTVVGRGRARVLAQDGTELTGAGPGESLRLD
jgi:cyanophycinase-like exopeptidase